MCAVKPPIHFFSIKRIVFFFLLDPSFFFFDDRETTRRIAHWSISNDEARILVFGSGSLDLTAELQCFRASPRTSRQKVSSIITGWTVSAKDWLFRGSRFLSPGWTLLNDLILRLSVCHSYSYAIAVVLCKEDNCNTTGLTRDRGLPSRKKKLFLLFINLLKKTMDL